MPSYSKNEVILVRYPFSALSGVKVRPAIVVNAPHVSQDVFIVPLTSRITSLLAGEFLLADWAAAGLHVPTALKRGLYTAHETLILKRVGRLTPADAEQVDQSLRQWFRARVDRPGVGTRAQGRAMTLSGEPAEHDSGADGPPRRLFPHTGVSGA
jgi:mRNA interferase MazF